MPNGPLTNPAAALADVVRTAQQAVPDMEWPADATKQLRATFAVALCRFLTEEGAEFPDVDLWTGPEFRPFHDFVLGRVVPEFVKAAAGSIKGAKVMTVDGVRQARDYLHQQATIAEAQKQVRDCAKKANIVCEFICPSPPWFELKTAPKLH